MFLLLLAMYNDILHFFQHFAPGYILVTKTIVVSFASFPPLRKGNQNAAALDPQFFQSFEYMVDFYRFSELSPSFLRSPPLSPTFSRPKQPGFRTPLAEAGSNTCSQDQLRNPPQDQLIYMSRTWNWGPWEKKKHKNCLGA